MVETNTKPMSLDQRRPLSPHIQIYTPMLTMMMSITHRITGIALYAGTVLIPWYVIALAAGRGPFATVSPVYGSWLGIVILIGFTWALYQHLLGGIRHAIWDLGHGTDYPMREYLARGSLIGGILLTAVTWLVAWYVA